MKPTVAFLVNIIAPYRLPVYEHLARAFKLHVFTSGTEANRTTWDQDGTSPADYQIKRSWGITVGILRRAGNTVFNHRFIHVTPGYLPDLVRLRPDAVISIEMGVRSLLALTYGTLARKPVWIWWEGTSHTERQRGMARRLLRLLMSRWCRRWISCGDSSTEYLRSLGIPRSRILQVQNCVDEQMFLRPSEPAVRVEPRPVLLYTGQMIGLKGVTHLLNAAAELQRQGYCFSLLLVGDGPERPALQATALDLGLANVHFYPAYPPQAMPAVYRSADYLVFPTLGDVWGLVVNEALWSGRPVLASRYAGCARELLPEENIFDPLDRDSFVSALKRALDGRIGPPDTSRLKTSAEVAGLIADAINRELSY